MTLKDSPSGIILAGGSSRRMGRDKALLSFPGSDPPITFMEQLIHELDYCCCEVLIVARDQEQASRYAYADADIILDSIPGGGPLVGLASALHAISSYYAVLVAVDMPFVTSQLLAYMLSCYQDDTVLVPLVNGHPQVTLAIYPRSILPIIDELIQQGRRDLRSLLDVAPVRYIDGEELRMVDPELRSFVGVNTPEELHVTCRIDS
jgi:molybdopterin-guanine dinucleotide biosynthesis protein A